MKYIKCLAFFALVSLVIHSCDVIPDDKMRISVSDDTDSIFFPTDKRSVLIEDFTGHKCPNCAKATEKAKELRRIYGDERVIVMAIHAGPYSTPVGTINGYKFSANYRSNTGNEIHDFYQLNAYPKGTINRIEVSGSPLIDWNDWDYEVQKLIAQDANVFIYFTQKYDEETRNIQIKVYTKFDLDEDIIVPSNVCAFLTESGMVSPQVIGDSVSGNYMHEHVLRSAFNESGTWGKSLKGYGVELNTFNLHIDEKWEPKNCSIIVYVYKTETMEILQASEQHVY